MAATRFPLHPREFEPLLPTTNRNRLVAASREVAVASIALSSSAHPSTIATLRDLVREMNSYYSNRIEGQGTQPWEIAAALRSEYSAQPERARLQRLAVAHIEVERRLEDATTESALRMAFLRRAHAELYGELLPADRVDANVGLPGEYRTVRVQIGRHLPPEPGSIEAFGARFDAVYGRRCTLDETVLVVAAAHHRASWIHPFEDGNGRATRLQSHGALFPLSQGLWSVSRALARRRDDYYQFLDAADAPRAGDLDGRGNLSDRGLAQWCDWFIAQCADQVAFMRSLLRLDDVERRLHALIAARLSYDRRYRIETVRPLHHMFAAGPISRAAFFTMTGLGERTARSALSQLLRVGLVTSPDHKGPVRVAFPLDCLALLFPDLYPEAASSPPTSQ